MNAAAATTNTTNEAAIKSADELASYVDASLASWRAAFESSSSASLSEDDDGGGRLKQQLAKTNTSSGRSAVAAPIFANNRTLVICNENDGRGYGGGGDGSELPARSPRQRLGCSTDGTKMRNDASKSDKIVLWKDSPADYRKRLATFHSETYFAKPLSLSPLVCAAFGWENTGKDIIKCRHPNCCGGGGGGGGGAPICITFHPSLNEESHNKVCQKYIDMLVSCHGSKCPFRTYASRWSKAMKQCTKNVVDDGFEVSDKGSDVLNDTYTTKFYVPPYFLSISDEFLFFEDCTVDGSITKDRIEQDAMNIRDMVKDGTINVDFSQLKLTVPDVVADYCHEIHPNADLGDVIDKYGETMKTPYLLATFGWSICTELADEDNKNNSHAIVKCNMCLARSRMDLSSSRVDDEESSSRKRRRTDATFQLIDSHRMYCPFKSGFAYRPGVRSHRPGWKVVVSNLIKKTGTEGQSH